MSIDGILGQARPIIKIVGLICVLAAAAKLMGFGVPIRAGVTELSLVGIGLLHV